MEKYYVMLGNEDGDERAINNPLGDGEAITLKKANELIEILKKRFDAWEKDFFPPENDALAYFEASDILAYPEDYDGGILFCDGEGDWQELEEGN